MTKCDYCGRVSEQAQAACAECGTPFEAAPPTLDQRVSVIIGVGWLLQMLGRALTVCQRSVLVFLGLACLLLGTGVIIWGCRRYAHAKGYPHWLGWLGLLSCVGLVILFVLPNRHKETIEALKR